MDEATGEVREGSRTLKPNTLLGVGEKHIVKGGSKGGYTLKRRAGGFYSCTCPAWINLGKPEKERTCNHLKTLLGDEYEVIRVQNARQISPPPGKQLFLSPRRKQGSSANGQFPPQASSKHSGKRSQTFPADPDVFPHAESSSNGSKKTKTMGPTFNERLTGPHSYNGGKRLLLADKWPEGCDPQGYWLSEKLDGVRAYWDGERMFARSGRAWNPPQWFKDRIPDGLHLDGELWMKRDAFDETSGICRRSDIDGWRRINFMAFDAPNLPLLYEERLKQLKQKLPDGERTPDEIQETRLGGLICVLPAVQCTGKEHLEKLMDAVLAKGGEGLMIRQPRTAYQAGRNKTLYKYKRWYDAEAVVVGYEVGKGRHKGLMGGVRAVMESGQIVGIGSGFSDRQRAAWHPNKGAVVRYRFQELSHDGTPRFPIFQGVVYDKSGPRDAIVRSTNLRADAKKEDLRRFLSDIDPTSVSLEMENGSQGGVSERPTENGACSD